MYQNNFLYQKEKEENLKGTYKKAKSILFKRNYYDFRLYKQQLTKQSSIYMAWHFLASTHLVSKLSLINVIPSL